MDDRLVINGITYVKEDAYTNILSYCKAHKCWGFWVNQEGTWRTSEGKPSYNSNLKRYIALQSTPAPDIFLPETFKVTDENEEDFLVTPNGLLINNDPEYMDIRAYCKKYKCWAATPHDSSVWYTTNEQPEYDSKFNLWRIRNGKGVKTAFTPEAYGVSKDKDALVTPNGLLLKDDPEYTDIKAYCKANKCWAVYISKLKYWLAMNERPGFNKETGAWTLTNPKKLSITTSPLFYNILFEEQALVTPNGLFLKDDPQYNLPDFKKGDLVLAWNYDFGSSGYAVTRFFSEWKGTEAICTSEANPFSMTVKWQHICPYSYQLAVTPIKDWPSLDK